jgi:hypothetical protein
MCAPRVTRHTSIRYSKTLSQTRQHGCIDIVHCCNDSVNCLYHARMVLSVGGSFVYFAQNTRWTVTTDLFVCYSNTQNDLSPGAAISSLHTFASSSSRNVNYDEKQLSGKTFLSCSFYLYWFRKYVSYGFHIIIFVIPEYIMKRPV